MVYVTSGLKVTQRNSKLIKEAIEHQERVQKEKRKPYEPSKWGRDMVNQIKRDGQKEGGYKPSGAFIDQLNSKGKRKAAPQEAKDEFGIKD